eukprot:CAMPEP_0182576288 /NCGR_PEP_ID=MMETSP1324-20130603/33308_1 /TAXON_ID=236786 /ORGANISM="Florenciella sp., Strain RCC1587" /LENGTH=104 /DNA_ID=CAMNT_0024791973 /DNA_START=267 /DNA_END=576 /DNA_ORIENTATION=-
MYAPVFDDGCPTTEVELAAVSSAALNPSDISAAAPRAGRAHLIKLRGAIEPLAQEALRDAEVRRGADHEEPLGENIAAFVRNMQERVEEHEQPEARPLVQSRRG